MGYCTANTCMIHSENFMLICKIFLEILQVLALGTFKFSKMRKITLKFDLYVNLEPKFMFPIRKYQPHTGVPLLLPGFHYTPFSIV